MAMVMRKKAVFVTTGVLAAGAALVGAIMVYGGLYNVASTEQHTPPVFYALETAMRQAVRLRARNIEVPPLDGERKIAQGAACFRDKCQQCHGAPGVSQADFAKSMQPLPGPLVDARKRWQPRELYWLTAHGIKMSGMPAWQFHLSEEELWSLVAFMQRLPDLTPPAYAKATELAPQGQGAAPGIPICGTALMMQPAPPGPGDIERGKRALFQYACNACHTIPGVTGSNPHVGPPLAGIAGRSLIAGKLANTPENMALWLRETQKVKPGTAMPQLAVTPRDARDIAAYLGTLN
jgi:mono/diheme cytochrome c family protein